MICFTLIYSWLPSKESQHLVCSLTLSQRHKWLIPSSVLKTEAEVEPPALTVRCHPWTTPAPLWALIHLLFVKSGYCRLWYYSRSSGAVILMQSAVRAACSLDWGRPSFVQLFPCTVHILHVLEASCLLIVVFLWPGFVEYWTIVLFCN